MLSFLSTMEFTGINVRFLSKLLTTGLLLSGWHQREQRAKCLSLKSGLTLENTTILDASYVSAGSTVQPHGNCGVPKASVNAPLCRVQFSTNTTSSSSIRAEAWLPDEWYGRFLAVGNAGLGGCAFFNTAPFHVLINPMAGIAYRDLDYGSALHFATVGSNNGHDGNTGRPFLRNREVVNDFVFRAIHVEAVIGKRIVEAYYGRSHDKAYYLGCSKGGRQGTQAALEYPSDFDGIIAGAPATNFKHFLHWGGMLARYIGAPSPSSSPAFIPRDSWKLVAEEILNQCDGIDGVRDGIITEPDSCDFRPESLLCTGSNSGKCLSLPQIKALRKIYSPLYENDELIYPRYDPGAEGIHLGAPMFSGTFPPYTHVNSYFCFVDGFRVPNRLPQDWLKYAVLNDTEFDFNSYGPDHRRLFDSDGARDTFNGDLSAFRDRGGKFLTYHGRADDVSLHPTHPTCPLLTALIFRSLPQATPSIYTI